jgi:transposase InsO family protein
MAKALVEVYGCSVQTACQVVGLAHSTFYYQPQLADESCISADLEQEAGRHPTYGFRRLTHQLLRAPYRYWVNRKRIQWIMRQKNLLRPVKRKKCRTTNSEHPYPCYPNLVDGLEINRPEQVWVCDTLADALQVQVSLKSGSATGLCFWQSSWMCSPVRSVAGAWGKPWIPS